MIHAYEEAYISEMIQLEEYPGDKGRTEKDAWIEKKMMLIEQFKEDHPDYPELAMQHAIDNAQKARM